MNNRMEKQIKKWNENKLLCFGITWVSCMCFLSLLMYNKQIFIRLTVLGLILGVLFFIYRSKLSLTYIRHQKAVYHVIAGCICFTGINYAYQYWANFGIVYKIANHLGVDVSKLIALMAFSMALAAYYFVVNAVRFIAEELLEINDEKVKSVKTYVRPFLILSGIYVLSCITIFRANYVYKDDMERITTGITVYTRESRSLAEFTLTFLETDSYFADISPLTQVLELVLMAASAVILFKVFTEREKASFMDIIAMIPFGLSPYFLECISFKYDPPQHGLAVFLMVLPLLFTELPTVKFAVLTALCVMLSCASHQVAMTVFPAAVIILCIIDYNTGRKEFGQIKELVIKSAVGYFTGLILYRVFLMEAIGYNTGLTTILSLKELIPGMLQNYRTFYGLVLEQYNPVWLFLLAVICICFYLRFSVYSVEKKKVAFLLNGLASLLLLALANSLYPVLEAPLHSPRHMYSFGLFTGMAVIAAVSAGNGIHSISKIAAAVLSLCFISFTVKYGNMLSYQKDYTRYRVEMVVDRLSTMDIVKGNEEVVLQVTGTTGYSPVVEALPQRYNLMKTLVTTSFDEYFGSWCASDIYNLYGLPVHYYYGTDLNLKELDLPLVEDNYYYSLYSDDRGILVVLKNRSKCNWTE